MFRLVFIISLFFVSVSANAQDWKRGKYDNPWSDSILKTLSLKQQIAQMMMVAAWSNQGNEHVQQMEKFILDYGIGGIIFFQGDPLRQAYQTNYYQQISSVPLMIGIDGEWGLAMRLKYVSKFPYQMTLGATHDPELIYKTGLGIGNECKRLGIHVNFAPDIDVNTNPDNPIIGFRSFGENPHEVEEFGLQMMRGMQDAGIMACAKHFPGHGDSKSDSHLELPLIVHDKERLESVEMHPFEVLFEEGVQSVMVGHLEVPALDSTRHLPSSLSRPIVHDLLQKDMKFRGLIFTDALNMKGVTKYYGAGYAEAAALMAGNDVLLFPEDVPRAIEVILEEVQAGRIDSAEIAAHVKKILFFKHLAGLDRYKPIETSNLMQDLKNGTALSICNETAQKAVTIVNDNLEQLPLAFGTNKKVAVWTIGKTGKYAFPTAVQQFQKADVFFTHRDSGYEAYRAMSDSIFRHYDEVIISIHEWNLWGKKGQFIPQQIVQNIYALTDNMPATVVIFGNIYLLKNLPNLPCVLVGYEDLAEFQIAAAEILYGKIPAEGHLPAMAASGYYANQGISTRHKLVKRFETVSPVGMGFSHDFTSDLNELLKETEKMHAAPGGELLVLKNGKQIYSNTWGHKEYGGNKVSAYDLYDLASITKVAATTLSVMKLYEQGLLKLDAPLYTYLPEFKGTNKEKLTLRSLMLHESGLPPFIPFYKEAMAKEAVFSTQKDSLHNVQVSANVWMSTGYQNEMWEEIRNCEVNSRGGYKYSDLNMIIVARVVKKVSGMDVSQYAQKAFYTPMHLNRTLFHPLERYDTSQIAPTTIDNYFRKEKVQGFVHDPGAAMFGGVAGHAGLFSNSTELAVLFEMLLNKGIWDEKQYLKPATVKLFTQAGHRKTHRGLGFDKPNGQKGDHANISDMVPESMFGHSGFTGNWAWADPENDIVFIFLSNRTYPDEENRSLIQNNIRTKAIELVYGALKN